MLIHEESEKVNFNTMFASSNIVTSILLVRASFGHHLSLFVLIQPSKGKQNALPGLIPPQSYPDWPLQSLLWLLLSDCNIRPPQPSSSVVSSTTPPIHFTMGDGTTMEPQTSKEEHGLQRVCVYAPAKEHAQPYLQRSTVYVLHVVLFFPSAFLFFIALLYVWLRLDLHYCLSWKHGGTTARNLSYFAGRRWYRRLSPQWPCSHSIRRDLQCILFEYSKGAESIWPRSSTSSCCGPITSMRGKGLHIWAEKS